MVTNPTGLGTGNDCASEGQQQLLTTDLSSRETKRPTSTNLQPSESYKNLIVTPDACFIPRQIGRQTIGRNIRLRYIATYLSAEAVFLLGRH
jgi:hypothetical protein